MEKMNSQSLVGKKIFLKLTDEAVKILKDWDLGHKNLTVFVSGVEYELGLWLWHPEFEVKFKVDKSGNEIPEAQRKLEEVETDFFIPWRYIEGIAHLRDGRMKHDKLEKKIGFLAPENQREI
ncbi:MAG: hypothetical protein M0R20_03730 [Candidatus Omnitrophica bacterium]|jgi:hypothetical protein|nr:hypothetical protein [Candidatus Omnitrophota bacterium]